MEINSGAQDAAIIDDVERSLITCGVCATTREDGGRKLLPCLHMCCEICSAISESSGELKCGICDEKFDIPSDDLKQHAAADIVFNIAEARRVSGEGRCKDCTSGYTSNTCNDCKHHLCDGCAVRCHRKHSVHTFTGDGDEKERQSPRSVETMCYTHEEEPIKLFCKTCSVPICITCTYIRHESLQHAFVELKDASDEFKKVLESKLADVQKIQDDAENSKTRQMQYAATFDLRYNETKEAIRKHTEETLDRLQREIRDKEKRMLALIDRRYNDAKTILTGDIDQLQKKEDHMKLTSKIMNTLINHGSRAQLLSPFTEITMQLENLKTAKTWRREVPDDFLLFAPEDITLQGELGSYGKVSTEKPKIMVSETEVPHSVRVGETFLIPIDKVDSKIEGQQNAVSVELVDSMSKKSNLDIVQLNRDKNDESLGVRVIPRSCGPHQLSIKLGEKHLKESPYQFDALPWRLMRAFSRQGSGLGELDLPYGVAITTEGDVAVADHRNHRVQVFKRSKQSGGSTGEFIEYREPFFPRDVCVDENLFFITVDAGALNKGKVIVRNENASIRSTFGKNELKIPCGVAVNTSKNKIYVADSRGHCVNLYSKDTTEMISSVGTHGSELGQFDHPEYMAVDSHSRVIVSDYYNRRLQLLDPDGKVISEIFDGNHGVRLSNPRGVAVDVYDNIYVCDSDLNRVQKLSKDGQFICDINSHADGLLRPIGVTVTKDSLCEVFVTDNGAGCINVFS
ncbi:E3 ubiquitin-protein ligase TRIM71-like [Ptychodera flava]|uniref:E3 ubiquitin-protein ligase TRIM71-like n=1 Tax=Ptychodera flava TaxID=63121 RepID=UPI00396A6A15